MIDVTIGPILKKKKKQKTVAYCPPYWPTWSPCSMEELWKYNKMLFYIQVDINSKVTM